MDKGKIVADGTYLNIQDNPHMQNLNKINKLNDQNTEAEGIEKK